VEVLEENYYLTNFHTLVKFVADTYNELLSDDEKLWYQSINQVSEPAQRLYVRLLGRRGYVFRQSKLKYDEIASIPDAASELAKHNLIVESAPDDLEELVAAFTKPELIKLLDLQQSKQLPRTALVDDIVSSESSAYIRTLQQADKWIDFYGYDEFLVFKLCFFGNGYQDLSEFVLRDLGVFQYEPYEINKRSRVFQSREQIDAHLQCLACANEMDEVDQESPRELLKLHDALPEVKQVDPHLSRRVDRVRNNIARQLERLDRHEDALKLYEQSKKPPARERRVRVLMKLERYEEAQQCCEVMQSAPLADAEIQFVDTITPKLRKLLNKPPLKQTRFKPNTTKLTLKPGDERVEFIAQRFFSQYGDCFYVENSLINGVLGLFIWDIIFTPIEGVFYNPFQSAPADFYEPEFGQKRAEMLELRFRELSDPIKFSSRVFENFNSCAGTMNPLVSWGRINEDMLSLALLRIPMSHWRALFERITRDFRHHTSGLPDLILFPESGSYEFLEVKGPGDAVQKNQRRWMMYFADHRIPYRVVHIKWASQAIPV